MIEEVKSIRSLLDQLKTETTKAVTKLRADLGNKREAFDALRKDPVKGIRTAASRAIETVAQKVRP